MMTTAICERCNRPINQGYNRGCEPCRDRELKEKATYLTLNHRGYGCDTGCCGTVVGVENGDHDELRRSEFNFFHGNETREEAEWTMRAYEHELGLHGLAIDWEDVDIGCYG